jgi:hypothetical protein
MNAVVPGPPSGKVHVRARLIGQRRAADVADDADDFQAVVACP